MKSKLYISFYVVMLLIACFPLLLQAQSAPDGNITIEHITHATDGQANGSIDIIVKGEAGPFEVKWKEQQGGQCSADNPKIEKSAIITGLGTDISRHIPSLCSGDYIFTVSNRFKCITTLPVSIKNCALKAYIKTITQAIKSPDRLNSYEQYGEIEVVVESQEPYVVSWNNGAKGLKISNLTPAIYSAIITTDKGCSIALNAKIEASCLQNSDFDVRISSGGFLCENTTAIAMIEYRLNGQANYTTTLPTDLVYYWEIDGKSFAYNTNRIMLEKEKTFGKTLYIVATNGCITRRAQLSMGDSNNNIADFFIKEKVSPCEGSADGSVGSFKIFVD